MAAIDKPPLIRRFPLTGYVDALRWLPNLSNASRQILVGAYDPDSSTSSLQTLSVSSSLTQQASITAPSRIISLKTSVSSLTPSKAVVAAATSSGSDLFYSVDLVNGSLSLEFSVSEKSIHSGAIWGIDLTENGSECVSVGEDGKINLVSFSAMKDSTFRKVFDSEGWDSYSSVKWASPVEFVTGAFGFSLQWWDLRKGGGPVALFKDKRNPGAASGSVHSIDIHTSRKHTCLAGGTGGTLFAWDIRSPTEPVFLSGAGVHSTKPVTSFIESTIWEVQYDSYRHSSKIINSLPSSKILPAMICSEDGILALIEQGEEPMDILAEPCSVNAFDINKQNPADVVCSLEWEAIAIITRV